MILHSFFFFVSSLSTIPRLLEALCSTCLSSPAPHPLSAAGLLCPCSSSLLCCLPKVPSWTVFVQTASPQGQQLASGAHFCHNSAKLATGLWYAGGFSLPLED